MKPYYEHAGITIYHGDCREVITLLESFDLLLTDPPYGLGNGSKVSGPGRGYHKSRGKLAQSKDYGPCRWDVVQGAAVNLARSVCQRQIIFGGNHYELPPSRAWFVWDKDNGSNDYADCELAWTNLDQATRKFTYRWNGMLQEPGCPREVRQHPTQKPSALMRWCIHQADRSSGNVNRIFDPFAGSGTVLVAAKQLGRFGVGIEIEERYCEIAAKRLSQEVFNFAESIPDDVKLDRGGLPLEEA